MPKLVLTLVNNAQQTEKATALLPTPISAAALVTAARNKLKGLRGKPTRFFSSDGVEYFCKPDNTSPLANGDVLVSVGEDFVGSRAKADTGTGGMGVSSVIASAAPVDEAAIKQLEAVSRMTGAEFAVGMPDLHAGNRFPIGAAVATRDCIYPGLIGGDIGCGMLLKSLSLARDATSADPKRLADRLKGLEGGWEGDVAAWLAQYHATGTGNEAALGTIGAGNHFAEIQEVESVAEQTAFAALGLDASRLCLLVHSGSRGLGQEVLASTKDDRLLPGTAAFATYLAAHDNACNWARANRELIAHRVLRALNVDATHALDMWHNNVARVVSTSDDAADLWLHRKGSAPADQGPIVIPGSRGARSYLVQPTNASRENGWSLAHGAGRLVARTKALEQGRKRYHNTDTSKRDLYTTSLGSHVICDNDDLLYEEAPSAYKAVDAVVQDLVDRGFCSIIAVLRPVVTYKMRLE